MNIGRKAQKFLKDEYNSKTNNYSHTNGRKVTHIRNTVQYSVPKIYIIQEKKSTAPHPIGSKNPQINIYQVQLSKHAAYSSFFYTKYKFINNYNLIFDPNIKPQLNDDIFFFFL